MVAPYYAIGDHLSGGTDSGTMANPWLGARGLQEMIDTLAAGETGFMRGTFLLTDGTRIGDGEDNDEIDLDNTAGTSTSQVKLIGTRADSWTVDGTPSLIDGNGVAPDCLVWGVGVDYWQISNVTCTRATGDGLRGAAGQTISTASLFVNCHFDDNRGIGADCDVAANLRQLVFMQCTFDDNDSHGLQGQAGVDVYFSQAQDNDGKGMTVSGSKAVGCSIHNNKSLFGLALNGVNCAAISCVCDGNVGDGIASQGNALIVGCRLTNNTVYGIDAGNVGAAFYNFFGTGNGQSPNDIQDPDRIETEVKGVETNLTAGLEGYEDRANDKFNLIRGAAGFRVVVAIDANNDAVIAMGLPNSLIVGPRE